MSRMFSLEKEESNLYNANNNQKLFSIVNIENKNGIQSVLDKKIRLDNKTSQDKKYSNLIGNKCNKYRASKCTMINLDKKDCINYNWDYQDKLNQPEYTSFVG